MEENHKVVLELIYNFSKNIKTSRRRYWNLMKKKKIKRKKFKRNKKVKRGGGINPFVDGFKFLYSIGKQYHKSTR